jgi:hypothetical protein
MLEESGLKIRWGQVVGGVGVAGGIGIKGVVVIAGRHSSKGGWDWYSKFSLELGMTVSLVFIHFAQGPHC